MTEPLSTHTKSIKFLSWQFSSGTLILLFYYVPYVSNKLRFHLSISKKKMFPITSDEVLLNLQIKFRKIALTI